MDFLSRVDSKNNLWYNKCKLTTNKGYVGKKLYLFLKSSFNKFDIKFVIRSGTRSGIYTATHIFVNEEKSKQKF